jgi:hypothetical protein
MCHIRDSDAIIWQNDSKLVIMSLAGETWCDIDADRQLVAPRRNLGVSMPKN